MSDDTRVAVVLVRQLNAPRRTVFEACTDPRRLARWLAPAAGEVRSVTGDPRVGGLFRLDGVDPNGQAYAVRGTYLEIVPDRGLLMTWLFEGAAPLGGPPSRVRIDLRALGADTTEMTLSHERIDDQAVADRYGTAWAICLDRLRWSTDPKPEGAVFRSPLGQIGSLYGDRHRVLQDAFGTRPLANRLRGLSVTSAMTDAQMRFVAGRDAVFLTTIDHRGYPTCSHKGGQPGFVRVLDAATLEIPSYDGNGMYLSAGNVAENPKVGLLFIDLERPHRLRVHGTASLLRDAGALEAHPGAELVLRVAILEIFANCPRYIHRYRRVATSRFAPGEDRAGEVPAWKTIDVVRDAVPERDRTRMERSGAAPITIETYRERLERGET
ncbi:SRPBCC domain-containing protein [Methylobacterium sp. NEAU 140]|uniref:SRPBCC domain-containing protein n=1 Tax=Methylobacterium sp. NEAU 140 TaxID=3064945 RepID=UPI002736794F|nr:SRPBCC domain-containing protein [Methylobacterium sp. NEAU 140]MDP4021606.1 SRPBCC domain-containing protein [Methylobacterium sp. NEAU 140]